MKHIDPKDVGDFAALGTAFGAVLQYLPEISATFAIIWTGIRIYEWVRSKFHPKPLTNFEEKVVKAIKELE